MLHHSLTCLNLVTKGATVAVIHNADTFDADANLMRHWLQNSGRVVTTDWAAADQRILLGPMVVFQGKAIPKPFIAVSTEQPAFSKMNDQKYKGFYTESDAVWCMDVPDYEHIRDKWGVPEERLAIVPVLMGGYFVCPAATPPPRHKYRPVTVLQYGSFHARRLDASNFIAEALTGSGHTSAFSKIVQHDLLQPTIKAAKVIIVINRHPEPCVYTIHRLAYVLRFMDANATIIVERCLNAPYTEALLSKWAVERANYGDELTMAAVRAIDSQAPKPKMPIPEFMDRVWNWDFEVPWNESWGVDFKSLDIEVHE